MTRITCSIHQPNFFPRLSTLAKLYLSDVWIVLDDVQFNSRDYQQRARLAHPAEPMSQQWLSLPVVKPLQGYDRLTHIQLTSRGKEKTMRRVLQLVKQHYGRSPYWFQVEGILADTLASMEKDSTLVDIAEASTLSMLRMLGWRGAVIRSSLLPARTDRCYRLVDLAKAVNAATYLCGTGGAAYLSEELFSEQHIAVRYVRLAQDQQFTPDRHLSALHTLAQHSLTDLQAHHLGVEVVDALYSPSIFARFSRLSRHRAHSATTLPTHSVRKMALDFLDGVML